MTFEIGFDFEHDRFSTKGPTPHLAAWLVVKPRLGSLVTAWVRWGFSVAFGVRPVRFAWNGIWRWPTKKGVA